MTATMISLSTQTFKIIFSAPRRLGDYLYAYERFRKFKTLDSHLMKDIGVTHHDIEQARYKQFLG